METIYKFFDNGIENTGSHLTVDKFPDICPVCKKLCRPLLLGAYKTVYSYFQVIFQCPSHECESIFVAIYRGGITLLNPPYQYFLSDLKIVIHENTKQFSDYISNISPKFCEIYRESSIAEQNGLNHICGVGYRKALEYLVKDFILSRISETESEKRKAILEEYSLQRLINEYIEDERVKRIARHAWWLGNDETHYTRKWAEKGLPELKTLIDMVVNWIEIIFMNQELCDDENSPNAN